MKSKISSDWLANFFNWIGDTFEEFNPAAFKFLSATLPYLTPLPVAVLTAASASEFLEFEPWVAFIFVFALEGLGLWFTSLFVDSVVDWIKSRNGKSFFIVLLFGAVITAYVYILVTLNVTLKVATGNVSPQLSKVITLLCFLPLLTGVGNGYGKLQKETKDDKKERDILKDSKEEKTLEADREREERQLEADRNYKLERLRIRQQGSQSPAKSDSNFGQTLTESESNSKKNWRQASKTFSQDAKLFLLNNTPVDIQNQFSLASVQTAVNWKANALRDFGDDFKQVRE